MHVTGCTMKYELGLIIVKCSNQKHFMIGIFVLTGLLYVLEKRVSAQDGFKIPR